jgi:hypothetical protein
VLKELDCIEMDSDDEPDDLFNKIAALKQRYKKSGMDDANYVNHVIKVAPKKYNSMIAVELKTKGDNVTLDDIQQAMKTSYRMNNNKGVIDNKGKAKGNDGDTESALIAKLMKVMKAEGKGAFFGSNFQSKCYKCGKPGHKAFECQSKGNNNKQNYRGKQGNGQCKFNGTCNNCGRQGHKAVNCWDNPKNKDKRPKNWKQRTNNNNSQDDSDDDGEAGNISTE